MGWGLGGNGWAGFGEEGGAVGEGLEDVGHGVVDQETFGGGVDGSGATGGDELQAARSVHDLAFGGSGHDSWETVADLAAVGCYECCGAPFRCPSG